MKENGHGRFRKGTAFYVPEKEGRDEDGKDDGEPQERSGSALL